MSDLPAFAAHARAMAAPGAHLDTCESLKRPRWPEKRATCDGCVPEADRRLWGHIADEADAHIVRQLREATMADLAHQASESGGLLWTELFGEDA